MGQDEIVGREFLVRVFQSTYYGDVKIIASDANTASQIGIALAKKGEVPFQVSASEIVAISFEGGSALRH